MKLQLGVGDFFMVKGKFNLTKTGIQKYYRYMVMEIEKYLDDYIDGNISDEKLHESIYKMFESLEYYESWFEKINREHIESTSKEFEKLISTFKYPKSFIFEPLLCPFCGHVPKVYPEDPETQGNAWASVTCKNQNCDADFSVHCRVEEVVEDWNSDDYKNHAIQKWNSLIKKLKENASIKE